MTTAKPRWDVFCKVVDNYGDAAVSWRLSRILATEHAIDVTLWIDRLSALAPLERCVVEHAALQMIGGVTVREWTDPFPESRAADVVVDAFGCGLPDRYVDAMLARALPPKWFILEYLSAEPWVDGMHGLASPHPQRPLMRRFWFPGFTPATGGLLRERDLFERRDAFTGSPQTRNTFWQALGVPDAPAGELRVSVFCYPDAPLLPLFDAWAQGPRPVCALVPERVATAAVEKWCGGTVAAGSACTRGALEIRVIPFLAQDDYDRLLWAADLNFVRGEDSLVRAQWAARPFVWQAYPQRDGAHHVKQRALVDRYGEAIGAGAKRALGEFSDGWNGVPGTTGVNRSWPDFCAALPDLSAHAPLWARRLSQMPELTAGLVNAAQSDV